MDFAPGLIFGIYRPWFEVIAVDAGHLYCRNLTSGKMRTFSRTNPRLADALILTTRAEVERVNRILEPLDALVGVFD